MFLHPVQSIQPVQRTANFTTIKARLLQFSDNCVLVGIQCNTAIHIIFKKIH